MHLRLDSLILSWVSFNAELFANALLYASSRISIYWSKVARLQLNISRSKSGHLFAYFFDQQNKTILCRSEDIQRIICDIILTKHRQLYSINSKQDLSDSRPKYKNNFIDRQALGFQKLSLLQEIQNQMILDLTIRDNPKEIKQKVMVIKNEYFLAPQFIIRVKAAKRQALQFLLGKKHDRRQDFFFASHQIREYYFVEIILLKMHTFNYDLLCNLKEKYEGLRNQWKKYFRYEQMKINEIS